MKVDGVTSPIVGVLQTRHKFRAEPETAPVQTQQDAGDVPESLSTEPQESQDSGVKGVIRNLLDGHYKGVADVRLRIVHYEELAAIESEQLKAAVDPEVGELLAAIQSAVSGIPELNEPLETEELSEGEPQTESGGETATVSGLYGEFTDRANGLVGEFKSGQITSTNDLIDGIKNAFADFVASLQSLLVPQAEEAPPVEESGDVVEMLVSQENVEEIILDETQQPIGPESGDTLNDVPAGDEIVPLAAEPLLTGPDYPNLIKELEGVFAAQITELTGALNGTRALPELSEPNGNGAAYKKFLGVYNELWSIQPPDSAAIDNLQV